MSRFGSTKKLTTGVLWLPVLTCLSNLLVVTGSAVRFSNEINLVADVCREATNKAADEEELLQELEDELQEMREEYEEDYFKRLQEYKLRLERWKQQKLEKVLAEGNRLDTSQHVPCQGHLQVQKGGSETDSHCLRR